MGGLASSNLKLGCEALVILKVSIYGRDLLLGLEMEGKSEEVGSSTPTRSWVSN